MKIFVISLKHAIRRRGESSRQLIDAGVQFRFFDAVEGAAAFDHFQNIDPHTYELNTRRQPTLAEAGCYASHKSLWQQCAEDNEPYLILEDDFCLRNDFDAFLPELESMTSQYGFVRLESFRRKRKLWQLSSSTPFRTVDESNRLKLVYLSDVPLCTVAYTINAQAALALASASAVLTSPVDKFLQRTWEHETPLYAADPPLVSTTEESADSTIGDRSVKSWDMRLLWNRLRYKQEGQKRRREFDRQIGSSDTAEELRSMQKSLN